MSFFLRLTPLLVLPTLAFAQLRPASTVGLEIPAPAPPAQGRFLAGVYVSGSYTPVLAAGAPGYAMQPYLRYVLGGASHRARPFVQYNLAPYWVQAYGSAAPLSGPVGEGAVANPAFAPLGLRNGGPNGYGYGGGYGYDGGGLGNFSVGLPVQLGRSAVMFQVGGGLLTGLLR